MSGVFDQVLDKILDNWTALSMAIQYGGLSRPQVLANFKSCIYEELQQCKCSDDLEVLIEDYMDSSFDMICEDNSPREIAEMIFRCRSEGDEKLMEILQSLPEKSDTSQWTANVESDEEDLADLSEEDCSDLSELTDSGSEMEME